VVKEKGENPLKLTWETSIQSPVCHLLSTDQCWPRCASGVMAWRLSLAPRPL